MRCYAERNQSLSAGAHSGWSKHGKSAVLKNAFKTFSQHAWYGSYEFGASVEDRKQLQARCGDAE